jgi:hypothetical protein
MTTPFTQLDFALAHRVLEDPAYAEWFRERTLGRQCILDNSFHELGTPLPISDLLEAAARIRADFVIAPDKLDDPDWTLQQSLELLDNVDPSLCAVVLAGETVKARTHFLEATSAAALVCLPYRKPRLEWFLASPFRPERIHLLGMSTFDELRAWAGLYEVSAGLLELSVDTSKPVKWGLLGESIEKLEQQGRSLRNAGSSKSLLEITSTSSAQVHCTEQNLSYLLTILE